MKKLFSKNETSQQNSLIGKVFYVGKFAVTVEDVIAEGNHCLKWNEQKNHYSQPLWHIYLSRMDSHWYGFSQM